MTPHRLAVWGDPIAHSKSPALHAAAYRVLGLDWEYDRRRVDADGFGAALDSLDASWRGLSLTMPLKEVAFRASVRRDAHAELTGAVNTLLLGDEPVGFNTDVGGILDALRDAAITGASTLRLLGVGATAASALVAARELGVEHADARARRPERAAALQWLGERLGIPVEVHPFDAPAEPVDLTVATLPSGTVLDGAQSAAFAAAGGALFDAAYAPWPSALAGAWTTAPVVSGLGMLLHQAIRQIRVFVGGDPLAVLDREDEVLAAMRAALDA
ncbi:shikimate dehydrogenase [Microbacterium sp. NPDC055903]